MLTIVHWEEFSFDALAWIPVFCSDFFAPVGVQAQLALSNTALAALQCLQVTPDVARAFEAGGPGKCPMVCNGCGCNSGPGFRAPPRDGKRRGDCVGFHDLIRICGPAPHAGCSPECTTIEFACLVYGRAWLAANAQALKLTLKWLPPVIDDPSSDKNLKLADAPVQPAPATAEAANAGFQCGSKRTCGEMASCEEAKFHTTQCGLTSLSRTPGPPCKAICGR